MCVIENPQKWGKKIRCVIRLFALQCVQKTFSPGNLAPSAQGTQAEFHRLNSIHIYRIYLYLVCSKCSTAPPSGRRDSSGIRLHFTSSLRQYDAGIMELGLVYTPVMAVPPQQRSFFLSGYCTSKCTRTVCNSTQTQNTNKIHQSCAGEWLCSSVLTSDPALYLPGSAARGHLDLCLAAAHAPGGPRREDRAGAGGQGAGGGAGGQALQRALPGPSCRGRRREVVAVAFVLLLSRVKGGRGRSLDQTWVLIGWRRSLLHTT